MTAFSEFEQRMEAECEALHNIAQQLGLPAKDLAVAGIQRDLRDRRYRSTRNYLLGREHR